MCIQYMCTAAYTVVGASLGVCYARCFWLYGLMNLTKNVKRLDPILPSIHSTAFYRPMPPEGGGINAFLKMHDNPAPTETRSRRPSDTGEQINHSAGHTFEVMRNSKLYKASASTVTADTKSTCHIVWALILTMCTSNLKKYLPTWLTRGKPY
jgi:hypothetical protein